VSATQYECCGQPCDTKFCPHCGRKTNVDVGIFGLLKHVQHTAHHQKRLAENAATDGASDRERRRRIRAAKKWESWATSLTRLLTTKVAKQ
jgi:hypothetical protein